MIKNVYWSSCKAAVIFVRLKKNNKLELSRKIFEKNTQISNLMKIRPVGASLFHADGQT